MILGIVVGVCGVIGGVLNLLGRGPVVAGAFIGLIMGLGGYATAYWWINGRQEIYTIEATIAYVVGCIPGFILQAMIQQMLKKRARSTE